MKGTEIMGRKRKRRIEVATDVDTEVDIDDIRKRIVAIGNQLNDTFVNRWDAITVMTFAHLTGEHYLFVGEPGTGKTAIAEKFASHIDAKWFSTTLGSFTSPEKIFGPFDINAFKDGEYKNVTSGKLPEAEIAFLDELFKCNDGCLNEMLTVLNERKFDGKKIPLTTVGTATNWPELQSRSDKVLALYDRILLRYIMDDVTDKDSVVKLLEQVDKVEAYKPKVKITLRELQLAIADVRRVEIDSSIRAMLHLVRQRLLTRKVKGELKPGIQISARRIGQLQKVLKASAWLCNRDKVILDDFYYLRWGLWNDRQDYETVHSVLNTLDDEVVQELVKMIDEGRRAYAKLRDDGYKSLKLNEVTDQIVGIVKTVGTRLKEPVFTDNGRDSVKRAMESLRSDFKTLNENVDKMKLNQEKF
jgi:MoxR-like ATPase